MNTEIHPLNEVNMIRELLVLNTNGLELKSYKGSG